MASRSDRQIRRNRTRVYRRRRLFALVAVVVLVVAIVAVVVAVTRGGGKPGGTPAAKASTAGSSTPSPSAAWSGPPSDKLDLKLRRVIVSADISPKSVVSSGTGYVFAQNMMYRHTVTVYDTTTLKLVKTISDRVTLSDYGYKKKSGSVQGAPVEAAETPDHRFMYVSQYSMYGDGFYHQGDDVCSPSSGVDDSFVYRVPIDSLKIDKVIKVGAVPKFLAVTPDQDYLLVSNWCSYSLSVVDVHTSKELRQVYLGPYPRGIAVDPDSRYAYVAIMGSYDIARVDLQDWGVSWIRGVGSGPRHVIMSPNGKKLYATLNSAGNIAKIDVAEKRVVDKVYTGSEPRSMAMAPDGKSLYVVNYGSNTMSKVRTSDMKVIQVMNTNAAPIGITYDAPSKSVWVCCYTGSIMVFGDR